MFDAASDPFGRREIRFQWIWAPGSSFLNNSTYCFHVPTCCILDSHSNNSYYRSLADAPPLFFFLFCPFYNSFLSFLGAVQLVSGLKIPENSWLSNPRWGCRRSTKGCFFFFFPLLGFSSHSPILSSRCI